MSASNSAPPQPALASLHAAARAAANNDNGPLSGMDPAALLNLISRVLPGHGLPKDLQDDQSVSKEAAAETLSNLSQAAGPPSSSFLSSGPNTSQSLNQNIHPELQAQEPGPNSHPNGPPSLDMAMNNNSAPAGEDAAGSTEQADSSSAPLSASGAGGRGGRRNITLGLPPPGSPEWARLRKDNHKEVERRRRGNINEGISELARIVPNGSGEKAKGAILSRAVQYIHHLKENEARNIEKWTLEKLLMDQAMGDLQAQLEEVKRLWEDERSKRQTLDKEVESLKSRLGEPSSPELSASRKRAADDSGKAEGDAGKRTKAT